MSDDQDAEKALTNFIQYGQFPLAHIFERVVRVCFKKKILFVLDGDYDKASLYDITITKLSQLLADNQLGYKIDAIKAKDERRLEELQERINITNEIYQKRIENLEKDYQNRVNSLLERQEKEVDRFEEKWNSPLNYAKYSKPSNSLLQLRYIERKQAIFKDYIDARKTKMEADKLQQKEEEAVHELMQSNMNKAYTKLVLRQDNDVKKLEDLGKKAINELKRELNHEIECINKTISNIKRKEGKTINKKMYSLSPHLMNTNQTFNSTNGEESDEFSFLSPRTASLYSIFRDADPNELNILPPTNEKLDSIISDELNKPFKPLPKKLK